jgi:concanavalin A-like lectin/glucanase superfamily protein
VPGLPPIGLVGAWSFDEGSGRTVVDSSGKRNDGTVAGATRVPGRFGGALQFDGVDDMVTVADAASLDLTTGMTLEAWIKPTAIGRMWRTVAIKEQKSHLAYALYANNGQGKPSGHVYAGGDKAVAGPSGVRTGEWSHVAMTWDQNTLRLFVNGTQVASASLKKAAVVSSQPLRFGGNRVWDEWFKGAIDEVRIYNRALTTAELAGDRMTAVGATGIAALLAAGPQTAATQQAKAKRQMAAAKKGMARATKQMAAAKKAMAKAKQAMARAKQATARANKAAAAAKKVTATKANATTAKAARTKAGKAKAAKVKAAKVEAAKVEAAKVKAAKVKAAKAKKAKAAKAAKAKKAKAAKAAKAKKAKAAKAKAAKAKKAKAAKAKAAKAKKAKAAKAKAAKAKKAKAAKAGGKASARRHGATRWIG